MGSLLHSTCDLIFSCWTICVAVTLHTIYRSVNHYLFTGFGLIRSNVLGSEFQFQLYQITNGLVSELIIHTDEQIPQLSEVGCARACAKQNGCLSLIFDSEAGRCSLLSRGILQNSSKPEIPYYIKVYTRRKYKRNPGCSLLYELSTL